MKWIQAGGGIHAVKGTDGNIRETWCDAKFMGYDAIADFDEADMPDDACRACVLDYGMSLVVDEPLEDALSRGFEPGNASS